MFASLLLGGLTQLDEDTARRCGVNKGDHLPAGTEPWFFVNQSYTVFQQMSQQATKVAD